MQNTFFCYLLFKTCYSFQINKIVFYSFATHMHQFKGQNLKFVIWSTFYSCSVNCTQVKWPVSLHHLLYPYIWQSLKTLTLIKLEMRHLVLFLHLVCKIYMGHIIKVMKPSINIFVKKYLCKFQINILCG